MCGTGTWDQCRVPVLVLVGFCVMLAANNGVFFLVAPAWKCVILTWQPVGELSLLHWGGQLAWGGTKAGGEALIQ